jgi:hypothetical protein
MPTCKGAVDVRRMRFRFGRRNGETVEAVGSIKGRFVLHAAFHSPVQIDAMELKFSSSSTCRRMASARDGTILMFHETIRWTNRAGQMLCAFAMP